MDRLSDDEVVDLIFEPGLSTAEAVTNVSGRGVGMDVVRTSVEKLGGRAELVSARGTGTTIRLRIPLTVAVVPARLVRVAGQRYALPASVEVEGGTSRIDLRVVLGLAVDSAPGEVVVVQVGAVRVEVVVDEVGDVEDLVVKPLAPEAASPLLIGTAVCTDGSRVLVVDPASLADHQPGASRDRTVATVDTLGARLRSAVVDVWSAYGLSGDTAALAWASPGGGRPADRVPGGSPQGRQDGEDALRAWVSLGPSLRVVLEMPVSTAHRVAGLMLDAQQVPDPDVRDAVAELVNMLGGTMREVVTERGQLGLPVVESLADGADPPVGVVAEADFTMAEHTVRVSLSAVPGAATPTMTRATNPTTGRVRRRQR